MTPVRIRLPRHGFRAFTIVELLVVIAILGVLVGLILPAIGGVQKRGRKTKELNQLKQLGHAWALYGINNNDSALPGFLDVGVQLPPNTGAPPTRGWGVTYEFPDKQDIPINGMNLAGPWTWRLLSYVDFSHELIHGYTDEEEFAMLGVSGNLIEAKEIADEPAFGYNGFYVGGYWTMEDVSGVSRPRFRFNNAKSIANAAFGHAGGQPVSVCTAIGQIQRSTELIVFCSASYFDTTGAHLRLDNDRPGSDLVTPPWLADVHRWDQLGWSMTDHDPKFLETVTVPASPHEGAPLGRYTGDPAIMYADGHVDNQTVGGLLDMRLWIDSAGFRDYRHNP